MSSVKRCVCQPHPWHHKSEQNIHEGNKIQLTLQKSQRLYDGLPPGFYEIKSQHSLTPYLCCQNTSLLLHTVGTNSSIQSRAKNRRSRTRRSNHNGTSIISQKYRIKWSSLQFYLHGGVNRSRLNEY